MLEKFFLTASTPFTCFGADHLTALALLGLIAISVVFFRKSLVQYQRQFSIILAAILFIAEALDFVYYHYAYKGNIARNLPLNLCDLVCFASIYALLTRRSWAYGVCFYVGLTITLLTLITPQMPFGFPQVHFVFFFLTHGLSVVSAIFLTAVVGMRPDWAILKRTIITGTTFALVAFNVNMFLDTNYIFLSQKPRVASFMGYLGAWPVYIFETFGLLILGWVAFTFIFKTVVSRKKEIQLS